MLLSEWYPLLEEFTDDTILIPFQQPYGSLVRAIENVIKEWGPVFVRLDERSPKYYKACSNSVQVLSCLHVPRTECLLETSKWLCLRKWKSFENLTELRCFMYNGLTAISQNDSQKQSEPIENPIRLKELTIDFIDMITARATEVAKEKKIPDLPSECTIDIAIDIENEEMYIVEVNPSFTTTAGSGHFDPENNPSDKHQMMFGQNNIRFRYYSDLFFHIEEC